MSDKGLIVVGVDGSASARAALGFALEEAARRSSAVRVVTVYRAPDYWPVVYGMGSGMIVPPSTREVADGVESEACQTIADVTETVSAAARAVPVELRVVPGSPADVLLEQAAGADLLVVGHRGRGAIASTCLGSVGLRCVLHAPCPVVVVRCAAAAAAPESAAAVAGGVRT